MQRYMEIFLNHYKFFLINNFDKNQVVLKLDFVLKFLENA
jgi:hypothetical protein